ncbi:MAG TPA: acyl-CoA dehydratase activase, partial [Spirochaetia bacterium]|nr:acyl-CoA dehydratase activase [Spirochaetia bacterium]
MRRLGLDIGSHRAAFVLMERERIVRTEYWEHNGDISGSLTRFAASVEPGSWDFLGVTGNVNLGSDHILDNTLCVIEGAHFLAPDCRNIFSIGSQNFTLFFFDEDGSYREHTVNTPCASGTGSFAEQQAKRLDISVSELAERACRYKGRVPRISTRCAVFAKSDIIHSMQEGYSLDAVCAGICEGIARNVLDVLVKGRKLSAPAAVVGGVSLNRKIVRSLEEYLGIPVTIPCYSNLAGAVGAALLSRRREFDVDCLSANLRGTRAMRQPLSAALSFYPHMSRFSLKMDGDVEVMLPEETPGPSDGIYLGLDIGSTSTKALLLGGTGKIEGGYYTPTLGDPVAAVGRLIQSIRNHSTRESPRILGSCTTGS